MEQTFGLILPNEQECGIVTMTTDTVRKLVLTKLREGLPAITSEYGAALSQAGAVCFQDQNHTNGVELKVNGTFNAKFNVHWQEVTDQMLRCWNDLEFTTEQAAYGVAFLLMRDLAGYTVIRRSRKGTGFDYWLGSEENEGDLLFQDKARLEVSGIRKGGSSRLGARVTQKLNQVTPSDGLLLPAYIVVVEFGTPISQVVKK